MMYFYDGLFKHKFNFTIKCLVLGFELTTSQTRISSYNHLTRAPAPSLVF